MTPMRKTPSRPRSSSSPAGPGRSAGRLRWRAGCTRSPTAPPTGSGPRPTLDSLENKQRHLRAGVTALLDGYATGMFVWGEGGTGKSYIVEQHLKAQRALYVLHNSRLTGRGLVDSLQRFPTYLHLIEDAETMMSDKMAWGVLRSAFWSQSKKRPMERPVTWGSLNTQIDFVFTGSILILSNANLAEQRPEIRAIKSRIRSLHLEISKAELIAMMKRMCAAGYRSGPDTLRPAQCWEVAMHIYRMLDKLNRGLDLRLIVKGFGCYLQWEAGRSEGLPWEQLVEQEMTGRPSDFKTPAMQKAEHTATAKRIHAMPISRSEKLKLWKEETRLSRAAYDRAVRRGITFSAAGSH